MESSYVAERRRHPRFGLEFDVQMQNLDLEGAAEQPLNLKGVARDVSESGMCVWVSRACPVNANLLLTFECPQMGWNKITSRVGLVVWAENLKTEGQYLLGIHFDHDEQEEAARAA
ncbi:PilZ domain-containing protein [Thiocystis violacea]|uniref:PilZ domain-containing protein n=1 Tax=Thiocystis violacea TaxID=13725 RepID=UPI001A923A1C|nr:PilZ domain-containing protein [Thiocystis violacea]